jgi:hypothetical protein
MHNAQCRTNHNQDHPTNNLLPSVVLLFVSSLSRGRFHNGKELGNVARSDNLSRANPSHFIVTAQAQHLRTTPFLDICCLLAIQSGQQFADRIFASLSARRNLVVEDKVCPKLSNGIDLDGNRGPLGSAFEQRLNHDNA